MVFIVDISAGDHWLIETGPPSTPPDWAAEGEIQILKGRGSHCGRHIQRFRRYVKRNAIQIKIGSVISGGEASICPCSFEVRLELMDFAIFVLRDFFGLHFS